MFDLNIYKCDNIYNICNNFFFLIEKVYIFGILILFVWFCCYIYLKGIYILANIMLNNLIIFKIMFWNEL